MLYNVSNGNTEYYYRMMTNLLGNCVDNVYARRTGNVYDVLVKFKPIHHLNSTQREFKNALNKQIPVILEYKGKDNKVYEA
jgi:hypothetical protein